MYALDHMIIWRGGGCRLDIHDQMWGLWLTGLGEVDLIRDPLHLPLRAVPRLWLIGRGEACRGGGHVFDLPPLGHALNVGALFGPAASEGLHRRPPPHAGC